MTPEPKPQSKAADIVLTIMLDGRWRTLNDVMLKARMTEDEARGALKGLTRLGALRSDERHKDRIWRLNSNNHTKAAA